MNRVIAFVFVSALALSTVPLRTEPQASARAVRSAIQSETLLQTSASWDGSSYTAYPQGTPQISVLKITIPAHTTMEWHTHPIVNAAYVVSGELTVERKDNGTKKHFVKGQALAETVDAQHRGITGEQPVELIVFYAGKSGLPLSKKAAK